MADKFEIDVKAFAKARQSGQDLMVCSLRSLSKSRSGFGG